MDKIKVLVLEDDLIEFDILCRRFQENQDLNHEFTHCQTFEEGLEILTQGTHSVALVDYKLSCGRTGIDFVEQARANALEIPFILLTGLEASHIDDLAQKAGADDFILKKEMSYHSVEKAIRYALERKRNREVLISQQIQMSQHIRLSAMGEMASGIAHEINNPVAIISGMASLLRGKLEKDQIDKESLLTGLEKVENMAFRIGKIVKSLQAVQMGIAAHPHEKIGLAKLIDDCIELCRPKIKQNEVRLDIAVEDEIQLECRVNEISQVLVNLINNAADAIEDHEEKWIRVDAESTEEGTTIFVTDSGNGLDKEVQEKIWTPYFTTKGRETGTGLGMSISKSIIESHQGTIEYNADCSNTQFVIKLPADKTERPIKTILIVDDEDSIRELISLNLSRPDVRILEAGNGNDALSLFATNSVNVVVTDINMPGISGTSLCNEILEIVKTTSDQPKIVIVTGNTHVRLSPEVIENLKPVILKKPFDPDELVRICFGDEGAVSAEAA